MIKKLILALAMVILSSIAIADYCYQESANVSTACGGLNNGSYNWSYTVAGAVGNIEYATDGDYSTTAELGGGSGNVTLYINYSKPNKTSDLSLWQVKLYDSGVSGYTTVNYSIPTHCWNYSDHNVQFIWTSYITGLSRQMNISCFNGSLSNHTLFNVSSGGPETRYYWEEAMFWTFTNISSNITFYDEINKSVLGSVTLEVIASNYTKNYTTTNGQINISYLPEDNITLRYNGTGYTKREYYLASPSSAYFTLSLYSLKGDVSSNITLTVIDNNNEYVENAYVKAMRYFFDNNSYVVVAEARTDSQGEAILDLQKYGEYYKFLIDYPFGTTIYHTNPTYITSSNLNFQVSLTALPGQYFNNTIGITTTGISFNNATNQFTYSFSNVYGSSTTSQLLIYKVTANKTTLVNSTLITASSGTLIASITPVNGTTYLAKATAVYTDSTTGETKTYVVDTLSYSPLGNLALGSMGMFMVLFLTIVVAFVGYFSLATMIVLIPIPLLLCTAVGLISFSIPLAIVLEVAAIIVAIMVGF